MNSTFKDVRHILLRSANWVGDAVMTTPAVRAVRKNFPRAKITLLAKPWVMPVFFNNPHVDEIMRYDAAGRHNGPVGLYHLSRDLRQKKFDLAIVFQNAFEAALLAFAARIPRRLGFATDGRAALLTDRLYTYRALKKGHLIDYYLGIMSGAALDLDGRKLELFISGQEKKKALALLTNFGLNPAEPVAGLNPGATFGTAKRWLPERFAELSRCLYADKGVRSLLFGGPGEAELGRQIAAMSGDCAVNLCGRTSLREAMALINQCRFFITNDSGLMHVAAALNIPQLAIIGPTDFVATGPSNDRSRLVRVPGICCMSPCMQADCPTDHRCMTRISVEMVLDELQVLLAEEM
jgi:heptosyltransferase-2